MTITYIRWEDAAHSIDECELDQMNLVELHEVGWLARETDETVTLAMERPENGSTRLWLCIPKVNILERRDISFEGLVKRSRRKRMTS